MGFLEKLLKGSPKRGVVVDLSDENRILTLEEVEALERELDSGQSGYVDLDQTKPPPTKYERNKYPFTFNDYIGQGRAKELLKINAMNPDFHPLIYAHRGLGKSTILELLAVHRDAGNFIQVIGGTLTIPLVKELVQTLNERDMVVIDEIHALKQEVAEYLLSCVQDKVAYHVKTPDGQVIQRFELPDGIMWAGATTEAGEVLKPLWDRMFPIRLDFYSDDEIRGIVTGTFRELKFDKGALDLVINNSQGVPRLGTNIVKALNPWTEKWEKESITAEYMKSLLELLEIKDSLMYSQRRYLVVLLDGALSAKSLAATLGVQLEEVTNTLEPYLQRKMLIKITQSGRELTGEGTKLANKYKAEFIK